MQLLYNAIIDGQCNNNNDDDDDDDNEYLERLTRTKRLHILYQHM